MKAKALRWKKEFNVFQEYVWIQEYGGEPQVFTGDLPYLQPMTATIERMKTMFEENDEYEDIDLDLDKVEFVELEVIESGEVGADIRNKLSPPLNLVQMLELFFKDNVGYATEERAELAEYIKKEMAQTKISVDYLAKLL